MPPFMTAISPFFSVIRPDRLKAEALGVAEKMRVPPGPQVGLVVSCQVRVAGSISLSSRFLVTRLYGHYMREIY